MSREHDAPTARPGSVAEFLLVAFPLIISCGSVSIQLVVDRLFLTWYSPNALAAATSSGMLYWTFASFAMGTASYVQTFVAQYEGAGRKHRVASALWQGIYVSIVGGLLLMASIPFSASMFRAIGHEPAMLQQMESKYFVVLMLGIVPHLIGTTLGCFFTGRGDNWTVLAVNAVSTLLNVFFDYLLIFGAWGVPEFGIEGAAAATALAGISNCLLYMGLIWRKPEIKEYEVWDARKFEWALFRRLLKFGLPNGMHFFLDVLCFTVFVQLVGGMGGNALASTSLAFALNSLSFLPMMGVGTAVSTLVGRRIGEGRPELGARSTWIASIASTAYMSVFIVIYLFAPDVILAPYAYFSRSDDFAAIHAEVVTLLRFVAFYSLFDALAMVFSSAIRGAGDTRFALLFNVCSGITLMVIPTGLIYLYQPSVLLAWTSLTAYITFLAFGYLWRFLDGKWRSMRVIEGANELEAEGEESTGEPEDEALACMK